ncbi:ABC-2 transporter permease [Lysinibacillus cavernae]|uniref:ABC-2 transporter permease n=1 Tax=Lysinibacillus cavernae TaxID=2666135 RepID=UPI0012D9299C|nr:ABC-2 transporter permease [Lysinibacillus cavernae]
MRALLLQRIVVQKWSILFSMTICTLLNFVHLPFADSPSIGLFVVVIAATLVENLNRGDRQVKWEIYVNSLPLSKKIQLQSDFLFCYGLITMLFILIAPLYFSQPEAAENFLEHFAMYFAFISSASFLICSQFYIQQLDETERMHTLRMLTATILIILTNFVVHYYLSLVSGYLFILVIPTLVSIFISFVVFHKCLHLYMTREIC